MFTYHRDEGICKKFVYGGCDRFVDGVNLSVNKFGSLKECEKKCLVSHTDKCLGAPALRGSCNGTQIKYSYHPQSGECKKFTYGGCPVIIEDKYDISINRFDSKAKCKKGEKQTVLGLVIYQIIL